MRSFCQNIILPTTPYKEYRAVDYVCVCSYCSLYLPNNSYLYISMEPEAVLRSFHVSRLGLLVLSSLWSLVYLLNTHTVYMAWMRQCTHGLNAWLSLKACYCYPGHGFLPPIVGPGFNGMEWYHWYACYAITCTCMQSNYTTLPPAL